MKRKLFLLSVSTLLLLSCEGPMGPSGEPGEGMNWQILTYTVHEGDWELVGGRDNLNSYYIYEFTDEKLLTNFIYESGNVFGYRIINPGQNNETQTPLPHMIPQGDSDSGGEFLWQEFYTFDFMPGSIAFYVYYSDFQTSVKPPTCDFRIVMNW
ncbi:MAG: hypothetical protein LBF85_00545 [Tannerella sp.]|jgi:hypothetical protein|nr:hypothetical protein [Tannerella sp.]